MIDPDVLRRLLRAKDRMVIEASSGSTAISEAYFARSFKDAFGVPPHRYLLTRRIERAAALLRDTDRPITDIAFETGWTSLGTFGRIFRDVTGEAPGELRAREQALGHALEAVPHCYVAAAHRPNLTISVLEKRRRKGGR